MTFFNKGSNIDLDIVNLNVGGHHFSTSRATISKELGSMLERLLASDLSTTKDKEGRTFIDRDPKHFSTILNFLRDGHCTIPKEHDELNELMQEIQFYQLDSMCKYVLGLDSNTLAAQHLRFRIIHKLQEDSQLQEAIHLLLSCAYGPSNPNNSLTNIPSRRTFIEVVVYEAAVNPLYPQQHHQLPDEMHYVFFKQELKLQGKMDRRYYNLNHESHLIHEDGCMSYDPSVYGGAYEDRMHIKTMDVYRHHCVHQLLPTQRRIRDLALLIETNPDAIQWALEMKGYKDVRLVFHARRVERCLTPMPAGSPRREDIQPVICNIRVDVNFSL